VRRLEERVRELGRLLGRKTLEVEIPKEALDLARTQKDLAVELCAEGRFPMKAVTETLGVAPLRDGSCTPFGPVARRQRLGLCGRQDARHRDRTEPRTLLHASRKS
jgi:hypothetical protein